MIKETEYSCSVLKSSGSWLEILEVGVFPPKWFYDYNLKEFGDKCRLLKKEEHRRAIFNYRICKEKDDWRHERDLAVIWRRKLEGTLFVWCLKTIFRNCVMLCILLVSTESWIKTLLIRTLGDKKSKISW